MNEISLKLDARTVAGKKVAKLRQDGFVPSVVYGGQSVPMSTQSPMVETLKVAHAAGKHTPVHLTIDGKKKLAIIKDIDIDPVRHELRHVAFHTINQNDVITTEVPVILVGQGESEAEKVGLVVLQAIEHLEVKAKPADLPESIELSIAHLVSTDDKITVGDIKLPTGVEFADMEQDLDLVIANVYEPSALQAANDAAGGDAEDEAEVEAENGSDTPQDTQAEESKPGGKLQAEPKQSNVDANK
ncbi:MAG: ribosomal protein [Candidatus Saccharibacteria bacterium]|nr:ribosomal protein [Candidatus Saccharibacteria bacterium]